MKKNARYYKTVDVTIPKDGLRLKLNCYWLCKDGDVKKAIYYQTSAQCNKNKSIPNRLKEFTEKNTGWSVSVVFLKLAYCPIL